VTAIATATASSEDQHVLTVAALAATYMQAVNISLPNAALLYLQGTLSMSDDEVGWVFTSYIAASAVTMPLAGWLAGCYGRKTVYQFALLVFVAGLMLATQSASPLQFVFARVVQGAASGILGPLSLAILLDVTSASRHARISLVWNVTLMVGLLSGPSIGGWLSDYHRWPSLFYVSLPVAAYIFLAVTLSLPEKKAAQNQRFDFFGLATLSLGMIGLQMMLDRGERMEWFDSAEIWMEAAAAVLGFYLFLIHMLTTKVHFLNKALFKDRNFVLSAVMYFAFGFVLLPTIALTSPMLDEILNYPAHTTGYMAIPRSLALVGALILAGRIPPRIDNRLVIVSGMTLVVYANWRMLGYSPEMDWWPVLIAGMLQGAGLGLLLPTLTKTAFSTLDPTLRAEGVALFNLSRLYGSTIGIALVLIFFYNNTQAMHLALAKDLAPYRAAAHVAGSMAKTKLAMLNDAITGQAAFVGVIGQFKVMMIAMLLVSPLVLLLRKPRPAL
jgi:MFS transporter, DHA2 family, multidrug resistance protein